MRTKTTPRNIQHKRMSMTGGATKPQLAAVTLLTLLALGAGIVLAGFAGGFVTGHSMESMLAFRR